MGAIVAALYGAGYTTERMLEQIHAMFVQLNPFNEYTLPKYSILRGRKAELASLRTFGRLHIEDLWVPYVCTSSNISRQTLAVHRSGNLSKAILATTAIPGITVPVIYDGEIHVDGGVMNNLPGDLIRSESAYLISCDVSLLDYVSVSSRRYPSPWTSILKNRKRAAASRSATAGTPPSLHRVPGIGTILNASVSAGSRIAATRVREMSDLALTPPVGDIGILDFKRLTEIEQRGYEYTMRALEAEQTATPGYA
jgi:predicted acylesterase/phospholipase RssA